MTDKDNINNIEENTGSPEAASESVAKEQIKGTISPLEGEGLRGDGTAKWYVVHT